MEERNKIVSIQSYLIQFSYTEINHNHTDDNMGYTNRHVINTNINITYIGFELCGFMSGI